MRATVRVFGNVQAVGYRALVKFIARSLGVRGLVRNLDDGSVEVFAEANEEVLGRFVKIIDVKGRPEDILSLHVERVEVFREGEEGYRGPWRGYGAFEIDYGEEMPRAIEKDMAESLEWAKLYFTKLVSGFSDFRREFGEFRSEFREFRGDLRSMLDERLAKMEKDIAEIKAKLGLL